jgi:hypothetical protein
MDSSRLSSSITGRPCDRRQERRLRLDRHVLLAAERAAVGHQLHLDLLFVHAEELRHLPPVVEDPLALRVEPQPAVVDRLGERAFGLEVEVLDALRLPRAAHHVRAGSERGVGIAAADDRLRQQVRVRRVHLRRARRQRLFRIEHGRQRFVLDRDQRRGLARGVPIDRRDRGEHVPHAPDFFAFRDEPRPVVVQQAVPAVARHVTRRDDGHDAGQCLRPGRHQSARRARARAERG